MDILLNYKEFLRGWHGGLPETPCGNGSKFHRTAVQRKWIPEKIKEYGITSIADLGAGDLNWASRTAFGCDYAPYDLIPRTQGVIKLDILTDSLPDADAYMVLWVINHMTAEQAKTASTRIMQSNARYLFATHHPKYHNFIDATVLDSVPIVNGAELRLIEL